MDSSKRTVDQTEVLEHLAWVRALARSLVSDPSAAEDVAQETWLVSHNRPPAPVGGSPGLRAWLARVARSIARQAARSTASRVRRERVVSRPEAGPSTLEVVAHVETQQRVVNAVLGLEEPARSTVLLRYFYGLSAQEIAESRGENSVTVRKRLSRALAVLRARLEREMGESEGGMHRALAPLAFAGWSPGKTAAAGKVLGGVVMSKTSWAMSAVIAAAALGVVWVFLGGQPATPAIPGEGEVTAAELALVGPEGEAEAVDAAGELEETASPRPGRRVAGATDALYRVLDPDDVAVVGARVALCADGALVVGGETDEAGDFRTSVDRGGLGKLLVLAPGFGPQVYEVPMQAGRHEVVLDRGAVVSGQVLVDGSAPDESVLLELFRPHSLVSTREETGLTWAELGLPAEARNRIRIETDPGGSFRFQGLPTDWSGELRLPTEYRLEDRVLAGPGRAMNVLPLDFPREGLVVRVERRLTLVGRVVEFPSERASPVPGVRIRSELKFPRAHLRAYARGYAKDVVTDAEGRFTLVLPTPFLLGGKIRLEPAGGDFFREVDVLPAEVAGELDLGDLALRDREGNQTLAIRVLDEDSKPVQGAVAVLDLSSPPSVPTDEGGDTALEHVMPGVTELTVCALGYETTDVAVPEVLPEVLEVILTRGTLLDIHFQLPSGEVARQVGARIAAPEHPCRDVAERASPTIYSRVGLSPPETFYPNDGTVVVRLDAQGDGRVVLNDLKPGVPLLLRVEGRFAGLIQEEPIAPLQPKEHRVLRIALGKSPRTLSGRVVNDAAEPLPMALVALVFAHSDLPFGHASSFMTATNSEGEFEIKNIYSSTVRVAAQAAGYVSFIDEEYEIPEEGAYLEVRLGLGKWVVTVLIEDENGRRWPASTVRAWLTDGEPVVTGRQLEDEVGKYLLRGLPDEELTITAYVHGVLYTKIHDPQNPELVITVPALGGLKATVHLIDESQVDDMWLLCLVPTTDFGAVIQYAYLHDPIIEDVLPGTYYAVLRRFPNTFENLDDFEEMSVRVPVEIEVNNQRDIEIWQKL